MSGNFCRYTLVVNNNELRQEIIDLVLQVRQELANLELVPLIHFAKGNQANQSLSRLRELLQVAIIDQFPRPVAVTADELVFSLINTFKDVIDQDDIRKAYAKFEEELFFDLVGIRCGRGVNLDWCRDKEFPSEDIFTKIGGGFSIEFDFLEDIEDEATGKCIGATWFNVSCNRASALRDHEDNIKCCVLSYLDTCHRSLSSVEKTTIPDASYFLSPKSMTFLQLHVAGFYDEAAEDESFDGHLKAALKLVIESDLEEEPLERLKLCLSAISSLVINDESEQIAINTATLLVRKRSDRENARKRIESLIDHFQESNITNNVENLHSEHARSLAAGVVFAAFEWIQEKNEAKQPYTHDMFVQEIVDTYDAATDGMCGVPDLSRCVIACE